MLFYYKGMFRRGNKSKCNNKKTFSDYNDIETINSSEILFYVNPRNSNIIWCFDFSEVKYLLENGKNPFTGQNLSTKFLSYLKRFIKTKIYIKYIESKDIEEYNPVQSKVDDINNELQKINSYVNVDQYIDTVQNNKTWSLLPIDIDINNRDDIINYLYDNKGKDNGRFIYAIVKYTLNMQRLERGEEALNDEDTNILLNQNMEFMDLFREENVDIRYLHREENVDRDVSIAINNRDINRLRELAREGANANNISNIAKTLKKLATYGHENIFQVLLHDYKIGRRDMNQEELLDVLVAAIENNKPFIIEILKDANFDITHYDHNDKLITAIAEAIEDNNLDSLEAVEEYMDLGFPTLTSVAYELSNEEDKEKLVKIFNIPISEQAEIFPLKYY